MSRIRNLFVLGVIAIASGCATSQVAQTGPAVSETSVGNALVDASGMTLYTYDMDSRGKSACTGLCASVWPPARAGADARPRDGFTVITRPDGTRQWAYHGAPLYAYADDHRPGDAKGDGAEGVWHVARP